MGETVRHHRGKAPRAVRRQPRGEEDLGQTIDGRNTRGAQLSQGGDTCSVAEEGALVGRFTECTEQLIAVDGRRNWHLVPPLMGIEGTNLLKTSKNLETDYQQSTWEKSPLPQTCVAPIFQQCHTADQA